MTKTNGWKKMFTILALGGIALIAPRLANADIANDIAAGKNAAVVAQEAVRGGMIAVDAALAAAKADPQSAVAVAVAVTEENPDSMLGVASALAQAQPEQSVEIVRALAQLYPDRATDIAAATAKVICGDDQRKQYVTEKKQDLLDVCSTLTSPAIEAYEGGGPANLVPAMIMRDMNPVGPNQDRRPASRI